MQGSLHAGLFLEGVDVAANSGNEAQVIQHHGAQVKDEFAHLLERAAGHVLEVVEFFSRAVRVAVKQSLADFSLQDEVGQGLRRAIVHLAGQALAFIFLRFDYPHDGGAARGHLLGCLAARLKARGGEAFHAAQHAGDHLLHALELFLVALQFF